jgi:ATP-dependent protease ClpP protease subunit
MKSAVFFLPDSLSAFIFFFRLRNQNAFSCKRENAGGITGSASTIEKTAESILETRKFLNELLAKHTHRDIAEVNNATAFDNFMNAAETIAFGLRDKISPAVFL